MTEVLLFHHAQGLTDGVREFADQLRAAGHQVAVPDLYTTQLQMIVDDLVPGLTARRGIGPVRAAQAIVTLSHPSTVPRQRGARSRRRSTAPLEAELTQLAGMHRDDPLAGASEMLTFVSHSPRAAPAQREGV